MDLSILDEKVAALTHEGKRVLIAVDGNCAAGKTTLAETLHTHYGANVFHMDDFFLRPEQRSEARLSEIGGNVDRERFLTEVLEPVRQGLPATYRCFDCATKTLLPPVTVEPRQINVIEGSYALHPSLREFYDIRVFLSVSPEEQMRRIVARDGAERAEIFRNKWIVLENRYFDGYAVRSICDFVWEN